MADSKRNVASRSSGNENKSPGVWNRLKQFHFRSSDRTIPFSDNERSNSRSKLTPRSAFPDNLRDRSTQRRSRLSSLTDSTPLHAPFQPFPSFDTNSSILTRRAGQVVSSTTYNHASNTEPYLAPSISPVPAIQEMAPSHSIYAGAPSPSSANAAQDPFNGPYPSGSMAKRTDNPDLSGRITFPNRLPSFEGTYSDIYKGFYGGYAVAIKSIRTVKDASSMQKRLRKAVTIWRPLRYQNVVPCYGYLETEGFGDFGAIVYPWYENGTAKTYLNQNSPPSQRVKIFLDVAKGLHSLHINKPQIVHGDLKPSNVLIDQDGNARLCDFGLISLIQQSEFVGDRTITTGYTNTARYLAPELVKEEQKPTPSSDIYALACVGYEFLYQQPPYAHIRAGEAKAIYKIYREVDKGRLPAIRPDGLNKVLSDLWDLLEKCWGSRPEDRPTAKTIAAYLQRHCKAIAESLNL